MASKTYIYRPLSLRPDDLTPLLPAGAFTVGNPIPDAQLHITIDEATKVDLDDAMASHGYLFVAEYTGVAPAVSRRDYGVSITDPMSPTPANGDMYYNSALDMEMRYDSVRAKWLSVESTTFHFGRNGNIPGAVYFRGADRLVMSATQGWQAIRSGTVVSLGYSRSNLNPATFEITEGGTPIATLSSAATSGRSVTLNGDFSFNSIIAVRTSAISSLMSDVVGHVRVKWRV